MALCQTQECEFASPEGTIFLESVKRVGRTGWEKSTRGAKQWGETPPVQEYEAHEHLCPHGKGTYSV